MNAAAFPPFPLADALGHRDALAKAMEAVLVDGSYVLGGCVATFEREFASWLGAGECVGVGSGTDALELILRAHAFDSETWVVVPAFAPSAVAAAVLRAGLHVLFADIEPKTFTLCPESLAKLFRLGLRVKAVIAVHLFGHPVDWRAIEGLCRQHDAILIEDGAQAHGAMHCGRKAGTLGEAAAFSFYPTKNLGALGDAGAVVTSDKELAGRLRELREYGWRERFVSASAGVNSRLDELQAAVLSVKLKTLDHQMAQRRRLALIYRDLLGPCAPVQRDDCDHAWHQLVVRCPNRDEAVKAMRAAGVPVAVHYPVPLHQQPAFANALISPLPQAEQAAGEVLSLPVHPYVSEDSVRSAAACILPFLRP